MQFASRNIDLHTPRIMGVLNVTPDSFFDGGKYFRSGDDISNAIQHAQNMVDAGASFVDVGGESTRPGAAEVSLQEEMDRVLPVVEALSKEVDTVISVDTSRPELMKAAATLGAGLINDVRALQNEGAVEAACETGLPVCLMHMQGKPTTMQDQPVYDSVVEEVSAFLTERIAACDTVGIPADRIILDPGFGFGKNDEHNISLLKHLGQLDQFSMPILVGLSRKSLLGRLLGRSESQRLAGSLALAQYALSFGANILRVHDVAETRDIVELFKIVHE